MTGLVEYPWREALISVIRGKRAGKAIFNGGAYTV
jgi:hypothetical protein